MRASDCPEAAANLMFWQDSGGTALSAEQRGVMLRSALLF